MCWICFSPSGREEQCGLERPEPGSSVFGVPQQHVDVAGLRHGSETGQPEGPRSAGVNTCKKYSHPVFNISQTLVYFIS